MHMKHVRSASYTPASQGKIERFNGTLKRMMYCHMSQYKTKKWNDVLPLFVTNYNTSKHATTGFTPTFLRQAALDNNKEILEKASFRMRQRAIKMLQRQKIRWPLNVGDIVRISLFAMLDERKKTFRKNYIANYSKKLYLIKQISPGGPWHNPLYVLSDLHSNNVIPQRFYAVHLQKIDRTVLIVNENERPDYSEGAIFNIETHAKRYLQGPCAFSPIPPSVAEEKKRVPSTRVIKSPRTRLIDELLQERAIQQIEARKKKKREELKRTDI